MGVMKERKRPVVAEQVARVRRLCMALPGTTEKLSHGEPTWFVSGRAYVMFANNHHGDGRVAVWLPAPTGMQTALIDERPATYFSPPYVGTRGWVGIELSEIDDEDLTFHVETAWELVTSKRGKNRRSKASG